MNKEQDTSPGEESIDARGLVTCANASTGENEMEPKDVKRMPIQRKFYMEDVLGMWRSSYFSETVQKIKISGQPNISGFCQLAWWQGKERIKGINSSRSNRDMNWV